MENVKKLFLLTMLLTYATTVFAQNDTTGHAIDIQLKKCLDETDNPTTLSMLACTEIAQIAWDVKLNQQYNQLMAELTADERKILKSAQKTWLFYRDNELLFSSTLYNNMEGTMWELVIAQRKLEIVKRRAPKLKDYHEMHEQGK